MAIEEHKAIVRRVCDEVWNTGTLEKIEELSAPNCVADSRPYAPLRTGIEGIKDMVRRAWTTFPDDHEELEALVAEGDTVVARFLITGTQQGHWGPLPPTGKQVQCEDIVILHLVHGKVVGQRGIVDTLHALRQLGVVPTPRD